MLVLKTNGASIDQETTDLGIPVALTPKELWQQLSSLHRTVALLIMEGMSNRAIAVKIGNDVSEVKNHVRNISRKLGLDSANRVQIAILVWYATEGKE